MLDISRPARRVCVVGAGPSGITAAKALLQRGVDVDVYERRDRIGGLWAISDTDVQASYPSLECNTSKRRTEFSDFPMPTDFPDYPHNTQMARYFEAYAERFGVRDRVTLRTAVERAEQQPDGTWRVRLDGGGTEAYDHLVVANGHHREPRWPDPPIPGVFAGRQMHAHDYTGPAGFEGTSAVVLGMGNSAMDIAVELSSVARRVYLASRRGAHIVPKYFAHRPIDTFNSSLPVPWPVKRAFFSLIVRGTIGRPQDLGLPLPDHRLGEAHPTVSQRITERVRSGAVQPRANIAALEGDSVRFADGTSIVADVIVYCTGYKVSFPFLDPSLVNPVDNRLDLFHQVFAPGVDNLAFIGLVQPFGALMPVAEQQAEWVADHIVGRYRLPDRGAMAEEIRREREVRERQFVASPRHTMEIDYFGYLRSLRRERKRGAARARTARGSEIEVGVGARPLAVHGVEASHAVGKPVDGGRQRGEERATAHRR